MFVQLFSYPSLKKLKSFLPKYICPIRLPLPKHMYAITFTNCMHDRLHFIHNYIDKLQTKVGAR